MLSPIQRWLFHQANNQAFGFCKESLDSSDAGDRNKEEWSLMLTVTSALTWNRSVCKNSESERILRDFGRKQAGSL